MRSRVWLNGASIALATLLLCGWVLCCGSVRAADNSEDQDSFEEKIIKKFLGGLGVDVGHEGIEYRERSPLVIPPSRNLPPPQSSDVNNTPNWPKDPDQTPKKRANKKPNDSVTDYNRVRATLSPNELNKGPPASPRDAARADRDPIDNATLTGGRPLVPEVGLFKKWFGSNTEQTTFTKEPERTKLTDPPPGYQTPSPNYAYGIGETKSTSKSSTLDSGDRSAAPPAQ